MIRLSLLTTVLLNFTKTSQGTKFDQLRPISNFKPLSKPSKFVQLSKPLNSGVKRPSSTSSKYLSNRQIDESTCNITQFFDKTVRIESVDNPGFYVLTLNEQELWIKHAPVSSSRSNSGSDFGSNINNAIDLEKYAEATLFKVTRLKFEHCFRLESLLYPGSFVIYNQNPYERRSGIFISNERDRNSPFMMGRDQSTFCAKTSKSSKYHVSGSRGCSYQPMGKDGYYVYASNDELVLGNVVMRSKEMENSASFKFQIVV